MTCQVTVHVLCGEDAAAAAARAATQKCLGIEIDGDTGETFRKTATWHVSNP